VTEYSNDSTLKVVEKLPNNRVSKQKRRIKDKEVKRRSYEIYNGSASRGFLHKEKVLIHILSKNVNSDVDWHGIRPKRIFL